MPKNIFLQHINSQRHGQRIHYHNVPSQVIENSKKPKEYLQIWSIIQKLDTQNHLQTFEASVVLELLSNLVQLQEETDTNRRYNQYSPAGSGAKNTKSLSASSIIHVNGGVKVVLRTLFHPCLQPKKGAKQNPTVEQQNAIQNNCLEVLNGLCLLVSCIAPTIGRHEFLLKHLFLTLENEAVFLSASALLEELLASNRTIIDLSNINNLHLLVSNLNDDNFPSFCRILASTVADIDLSEERSTLIAQDKEDKSRQREKALVDRNQGLLLSFPEFLSKMVKLTGKPLPTIFGNRTLSRFPLYSAGQSFWLSALEEDDQMEQNPTSLSSINGSSPSGLGGESIDRGTQTRNETRRQVLPIQIPFMQEVMHKVEILYVLTLLLCGKSKRDVQARLGDMKFIPILSELFDKMVWNSECERFPRHSHQETEECDCTPESALKIQFLRFVHSFCDHNEKRYYLLSSREVQEMKDLYTVAGVSKPVSLEKAKNKYRCPGNRGLITRIIDVLIKTNSNNALRFWLSRAIEGFLRGNVSAPDQFFLMERGLVKHLVQHITDRDTKSKEIIQSSFDLLGELMKFNSTGFQHFNDAIESDEQFETFLSVMTSNVVDSNMFIRSAVLSHDRFASAGTNTKCKLGNLIRKWEHKIYLMYKLITSISVDSLTQENVSCLNTTLIFLMFAHNHGQLDKYLQAFLLEEEAQKHPGLILSNLYDLLCFWRDHYLSRKKDCEQLEQSSSISFKQWQQVVDVMLNEDFAKRTSIVHYLKPHLRNKMRFRGVEYLSRVA